MSLEQDLLNLKTKGEQLIHLKNTKPNQASNSK